MIARAIGAKLSRFQAERARRHFDQRLADFTSRFTDAEKRWLSMMAPYRGVKVVTYHRSYTNFADRFSLNVIG